MERFDHLYMNIAKEAGGIEGLLNSFFSFLYRRTDFFYEADPTDKMGFPPGVNQQLLLSIFKQYQDEYYKKVPKKSPEEYKQKLEALKAKQESDKQEKNKQELKAQDAVTPTPVQKTPEPLKPENVPKTDSKPLETGQKQKETQKPAQNEPNPQVKAKDDEYNDIR